MCEEATRRGCCPACLALFPLLCGSVYLWQTMMSLSTLASFRIVQLHLITMTSCISRRLHHCIPKVSKQGTRELTQSIAPGWNRLLLPLRHPTITFPSRATVPILARKPAVPVRSRSAEAPSLHRTLNMDDCLSRQLTQTIAHHSSHIAESKAIIPRTVVDLNSTSDYSFARPNRPTWPE